MFGNWATGGAINFGLWRGGEINGARFGSEGGSFGYLNNYAIIGGKSDTFEGAAFGGDVRGDGHVSHSAFNTQTINALGTYAVTPMTASHSSLSTTGSLPISRYGSRSINSRPTCSSAVATLLLWPRPDAARSICSRTAFGRHRFPDRRAGQFSPPRFQNGHEQRRRAGSPDWCRLRPLERSRYTRWL
jgi:hypothetical protein